MSLFRRAVTVSIAAGLALSGSALPGRADAPSPTACTDSVDAAVPFSFAIGDTTATGHFALPAGDPVGIVAMFHGYGHTSTSWREHLARTARTLNVIAVAMDYRGTTVESTNADGIESSRGWRVSEGAEETNAVVRAVLSACPTASAKTVAFGVSMGGNASGLAVAAGDQRPAGGGLYDWWFDIEGATNVIDTYTAARALGAAIPTAATASIDIREETGCELEACPEKYEALVVANKADRMKAAGLKGVVLVHGVDDGLVPYHQTRQMIGGLLANQLPFEMYTTGTRGNTEAGTTATGYVLNNFPGKPQSPLAGHASERSTTHLNMVTAFNRLADLFGGRDITGFHETVVDSNGTVALV